MPFRCDMRFEKFGRRLIRTRVDHVQKTTVHALKGWLIVMSLFNVDRDGMQHIARDDNHRVLFLVLLPLPHRMFVHATGLNESSPPNYCYKHEPRQTGRGGGGTTIYSDILNVTQKTGFRFNSFEILMLNVTLSYMQNKSVLSLWLLCIDHQGHIQIF